MPVLLFPVIVSIHLESASLQSSEMSSKEYIKEGVSVSEHIEEQGSFNNKHQP